MKYEFTGETQTIYGTTLKRIRALRAIERYNINAGDLGGWIESEKNLDQDSDARVSGDAWVSGDAQVYGNAWDKSPLYIQGSKYSLYMATANKVACGCQIFTFEGWHKHWREIAEKFNMSADEQAEYVSYFNLACDRYNKQKYKIDFTDGSESDEIEELKNG